MFSVFRGTKYDDIRPNHTKKNNQKPTHMVFEFLWTGQGTFLVQDFHRPNGAKILRFRNFPETMTYPESLENCQKSKSFSKIWLWKSWTFDYFLDRTRKQPHFQTMIGLAFVSPLLSFRDTLSYVFCICLLAYKYQKCKSVELGDQLLSSQWE